MNRRSWATALPVLALLAAGCSGPQSTGSEVSARDGGGAQSGVVQRKRLERLSVASWSEQTPMPNPTGDAVLVLVSDGGKQRLDMIDATTGQRSTLLQDGVVDASWLDGERHFLYTNRETRAVSMRSLDGVVDEEIFAAKVLATDWKPRLSPDGTYAAVGISTRRGHAIYVVDIVREQILARVDGQPDGWHPDSRQFLLTREVAGREQVFVYDVAAGRESRLTNDAYDNRQASFSPDGSRVVFSSNRNGRFNLYTMSAIGGDLVALTRARANDLYPNWGQDGYVYFTSDRDVASGNAMNTWRVRPGA